MQLGPWIVYKCDAYPPEQADAIKYAYEYASSIFGHGNIGPILHYLMQQEDFHYARMREMSEEDMGTPNGAKRWNAHERERLAAYLAVRFIDEWCEASGVDRPMDDAHYCCDCGTLLRNVRDQFWWQHLPIDVDSANAGESAVLCWSCNNRMLEVNA